MEETFKVKEDRTIQTCYGSGREEKRVVPGRKREVYGNRESAYWRYQIQRLRLPVDKTEEGHSPRVTVVGLSSV